VSEVGIDRALNGSAEAEGGSDEFRRRLLKQKMWRRGSESNRRIKVLQTSPLPLGYRALTVLALRAPESI
jgi:hypothetical protein